MELRLLGPIEAVVDGRPVDLGSVKQRMILAILALASPQPVPVDTLIAQLWDEEPPTRPRETLYSYLSRLRRALGTVDIARVPGGYRLLSAEQDIDLHRFRALVARARQLPTDADGERVELLLAAERLWRGAALAGLPGTWLGRMRDGLAQQQLNATAARIDAQLRLGGHHAAVEELIDLVGAHPLSERLIGQLMVALERSGQRAAALQCFAETRSRFVEALGEEPGAPLRELHTRMLRGDGAARPAPAAVRAPCQLPRDLRDFTGRAEELRLTRDTVLAASRAAPWPPVVHLSGMGGTGKTTLAVRVAYAVRDSFPDGQLFVQLRGLDERPTRPEAVLTEFLRALGVTGSAVPDGPQERAAVYREALRDRRVLIVLDDAADEAQIRPLLPGAGRCAVIVTSRGALGGIEATRARLGPLGRAEAVTLLRRMSSDRQVDAAPDAADRVVDLCSGLPLALRIVAARLASRQHWTVTHLVDSLSAEHDRLDALSHSDLAVRASLALSHRVLSAPAADLLRQLALLPPVDFPTWVAAAVAGVDLAVAWQSLEELSDCCLVEVSGPDPLGQLRYRLHDLVRLYAREHAPPGLEAAASRARHLAGWLALVEEAERRSPHGFLGPTPAREEPDAAPAWVPEVSDRVLADPFAWWAVELPGYLAAVEDAARYGHAETAWRLARGPIGYLETRGGYADWRRTHTVALAAAEAAGDLLGEATMRYGLGELTAILDDLEASGAQFEAARRLFTALGDPQGQAMAGCGLAHLARVTGRTAEAERLLADAAGAAATLGADRAPAYVDYLLGMARLDAGLWAESGAAFGRAARTAARIGHLRGEMQARRGQGGAAFLAGNLAAADGHLRASYTLSARYGDELGRAHSASVLAYLAVRMGEPRRAEELFAEALGICHRLGSRFDQRTARHLNDAVYLALGRSATAREHIARAWAATADVCEKLPT